MGKFEALLLLFALYSSCGQVDSAKVLVIPNPAFGHTFPVVQMSKVLKAKYNHTTTFVLPEYMMKYSVIQNEKLNVILSKGLQEVNFLAKAEKIVEASLEGKVPIILIANSFLSNCYGVLGDQDLMNDLMKEKYDLLIVTTGVVGDCFNFVGYKLSIPIVQYSNFYDSFHYGIPNNPFVTPVFPFATFGEQMSIKQKVFNTIMHYTKSIIFSNMQDSDLSTKYVPEKPYISIQELRKQVEFVFFDVDVLLDYPMPSMPNTAFVGGLNTGPAKPLNKDFQTIMDTSVDGVVVVSFGSVVNAFPENKRKALFDAMKKVKKLTFVMKFGTESKDDGNIIMRPWLPQNDLLGHKNTKAFITHCGNSGQFEALYHGVPMIGVPVNGDEFYNAERMKNKGYGLYVAILQLETGVFAEMIKEVVTKSFYKENIYKASIIYRSRMGGLASERASFWIDHVIKYGGNYMQSASLTMQWYVYCGLDVIFMNVLAAILFVSVVVLSFKKIRKYVCKKKKVKTS